VLFAGYIALQIPSNMLLTRVRPSIYLVRLQYLLPLQYKSVDSLACLHGSLGRRVCLHGSRERLQRSSYCPVFPGFHGGVSYCDVPFLTRSECLPRLALSSLVRSFCSHVGTLAKSLQLAPLCFILAAFSLVDLVDWSALESNMA
jgi:hypothetical protein